MKTKLPTDETMTETFAVGERYHCTLTLPRNTERGLVFMTAEWSPDVPSELTPGEVADYRRGRDAFLLRAACALGGSACVIE